MPAKDRREAKAEREVSKTVEKTAKQKQQEEVRGPPAGCARRHRPKRFISARAAARRCRCEPVGCGCARETRVALRCGGRSGRCGVCARQQGRKQR